MRARYRNIDREQRTRELLQKIELYIKYSGYEDSSPGWLVEPFSELIELRGKNDEIVLSALRMAMNSPYDHYGYCKNDVEDVMKKYRIEL